MESNFFSGSENLYKYLVTIGILMLVLTIYYPLKEKQELEILKINLKSELKVLNLEIKDNNKSVNELTKYVTQKNISESEKNKLFSEISQNQKANEIKQIKADGKLVEIKNRDKYINIYDNLFWAFIVTGSGFIVFGFFKWYNSKKVDDSKCEIEVELLKLKLEEERLRQNNSSIPESTTPPQNQSPTT
ncbi:MAG: hypothetical protein DI622_00065 [Chryseobacterium sp.]|nr:MAG: hypothetical protein DI622_00065 [Chryseobacterium sp.]